MAKRAKTTKENPSIAEIYGYNSKHFKKWGKLGGRPAKYLSDAERQRDYRRRKAQKKLLITGGILSQKTGRISQYRSLAEKKRAYRARKRRSLLQVSTKKLGKE